MLNIENEGEDQHHANMAGIVTSLMDNIGSTEWIIDSSASHHISGSLDVLNHKFKLIVVTMNKFIYLLVKKQV